jgi:hypothetical protein
VCFGTRCIVFCKSRDVEIVLDAASVFDMGGKPNGGVGRKKEYIYSSFCDLTHILHFLG